MLNTNKINSLVDMYKPIKKDYGQINLKQAEEIGWFKFGSVIVLLVETPKNFEFVVKENDKIRYGQLIGQVKH